MPASFMTLFPHALLGLETAKFSLQSALPLMELNQKAISLSFSVVKEAQQMNIKMKKHFLSSLSAGNPDSYLRLIELYQDSYEEFLDVLEKNISRNLGNFQKNRKGELEFIKLLTEDPPPQDWTVEYDDDNILLDLPSMRVIDISSDVHHKIKNYAVVFAPRAGQHSNIAEKVAIYLRDNGLTRMAVVEQKCAEDIPLLVDGQRHYEGFDSQVEQYSRVLESLKEATGYPPHVVAICQPGPMLITSVILHPELAKTFGSGGAPMNTEGERGYLTDFAQLMGEGYVDRLLELLGRTVPGGHIGEGREYYDGRLQVMGFYSLRMGLHLENLRGLLRDLRKGNEKEAGRQKIFYQWYNYTVHFPAGFIRDTFKKVFVKNELIRGTLTVNGKKVNIRDYPGSVPIWALGGVKDDIAPPRQATGHMDFIESVKPEDKLVILCDGGHMGLFRSRKILKKYYAKIIDFLLAHSDKG